MTKTSLDKNARDRVGTAGTGRRALAGACVAVTIVSQRGTKSSLFFQDLGGNVYERTRETRKCIPFASPVFLFPRKTHEKGVVT